MSKENTNNLNNKKSERQPYERIFTVTESYAGKKNLSDIFADMLHSAYCKREPDDKGNELNLNSYLPNRQTGQTHYGDGAY